MKRSKEVILALICGILVGTLIALVYFHKKLNVTVPSSTSAPIVETIDSEIKLPDTINYTNDLGEAITDYSYVEEIDGGGIFEELSLLEIKNKNEYYDLGAIETDVDTSSPENFKDSTLGRCIYANNFYGAQCVSLFRAFSWAYAGRDISTCGTGLAKGMMECYEENAGDDYIVVWNKDEIIEGTWTVFDGSSTGHVCMALSKPKNGYIECLGENQGGRKCDKGGSATNIINLSLKNFIGGYIPVAYVPKPDIIPDTSH